MYKIKSQKDRVFRELIGRETVTDRPSAKMDVFLITTAIKYPV